MKRVGTSGLPNVTWFSQYQRWKGSFRVRGRIYFVGHFDDKFEAHRVVQERRNTVITALAYEGQLSLVAANELLTNDTFTT
jgi:hypothetical protein